MQNISRVHGLALMAVGVLVFSGTTDDVFPAEAFWPALVLCCIGFFVFVKANRLAMEDAEKSARRAIDPVLENERGHRYAETQAKADGKEIAGLGERDPRHDAHSAVAEQLQKLTKLRDGGILSEEEFAIAKAKLLG